MVRIGRGLTVLFLVMGYTGFSQSLNPDSLREELKIYRDILENDHSGLYLYTSRDVFDDLFNQAQSKVDEINCRRDYFKLVAEIHTSINCGHSSVFYPFSEEEAEEFQNSLFPARIKFLGTKAYVAESKCDITPGSEIISINNHLIDDITSESFRMISSDGYNTTFKYRQLEEEFAIYLYLLYGSTKSYEVKYRDYDSGIIHTNVFDALNLKKLEQMVANGELETPKDESFDDIYQLKHLDAHTSLLTVNSFNTETPALTRRYFKFLKKSFREVKERGVQNLIIDIRENTGGNDGNDMELASYLIDRPFKENKYRRMNTNELIVYPCYLSKSMMEMIGMKEDTKGEKVALKLNKEVRKEFGDEPASDGYYYLKDKYVIHRDPQKDRFQGQVYIMISGKVFSGGGLFSALVRDKSDAVFVGEETGGGYYRHTGSIPLCYELPYSKLEFSIFTVINEQDVEQQLYPNGSGTRPHYSVCQTPEQLVNGEDAVLKKCLSLIATGR
ncbi:hypothetical protein DMA11_15645 [Marinilabiliaceae bacterium JC017]|nr:hypothetical protein DMA11_15645 [Marinilabiliaceae bacterium JC017]